MVADSKIAWTRPSPSPKLPRDGDKVQARQRINVEVRTGRRASEVGANARVAGSSHPTIHTRWLTVIHYETEVDVREFREEQQAREYFEQASEQWSESYLCRVVQVGGVNVEGCAALSPLLGERCVLKAGHVGSHQAMPGREVWE